MTRNQMIFALTKYELEFLNSNPEHLDLVTDFFVHGGYNNYSDGMLSSIYTDKIGRRPTMPKYEVCIVSKEYRYIEVEANNESDAKDMAWEKVACGYTCDTKADDYDTEVFIDSLIEENTNA